MTQTTRKHIVIATSDPTLTKLLTMVLVVEGFEVVSTKTADEAFEKCVALGPHLIVIDYALPGGAGPALSRKLRKKVATRHMGIFILTASGDVAEKIAAFEAGADEQLAVPFDSKELAYRVKNLVAHITIPSEAKTAAAQGGRVIVFFGTKGGVGKATVAVNTALTLHRKLSGRVLIFDADFYFGDVGIHLNLPPTHNVSELVEHIDEIDPELVEQIVLRHSSGLRVLLSPFQPEKAELITPEHVKKLLAYLVEKYDYVMVDCHGAYEDRILSILERADEIMLVITPEVGPIKNTSVFLDLAGRLNLPLDKIHIILNRANSDVGINIQEIERTFRHRIEFSIISGGRAVVLSVNQGQPLALTKPDHPLAQETARIADWLIKSQAQVPA